MVSVKINKNRNGKYVSFSCKGHAGYDEYGKDIVCAALSMLIINTINSIESLTGCKFTVDASKDGGDIKVSFDSYASDKASLLIDSMILGIRTVEEEYGKSYVSLSIKEV